MLQQALFTSVRGSRVEGYHLAVSSAGLEADDARELAHWGPAHDALLDSSEGATSVNFFRLESGRYAISQTTTAGEEYSGRGGQCLATSFLVCDGEMFERFGHNPFRLLDAAMAAGWPPTFSKLPETLPPLVLTGRASAVETLFLAESSAGLGAHVLERLVDSAIQLNTLAAENGILAVSGPLPAERLIRALFSLLPLDLRGEFSFTTGLRFSSQRPFRIQPLPKGHVEQKKLLRQSGATVFDATAKTDSQFQHEWAQLVAKALGERRLSWFAREVERSGTVPLHSCPLAR